MGYEFYVDEYWRFCLPANEKFYKTYDDLRDAVEAIDKAKQSAARRKMDLVLVNGDGQQVQVSGIHAGHGGLISKPKIDKWNTSLYANVPWVVETIREINRLKDLVSRMEAAIYEFRIDHWDNNYSPSRFVEVVTGIEKQVAEKAKAAEKTTLEKELADVSPKPRRTRF